MLRKYLPILGLATIIAVSSSCVQSSRAGDSVSSFFGKTSQETIETKQFSSASIKALSTSTSGGNIEVVGDAGAQCSVEVIASSNKFSGEALKQKVAELYTINNSMSGNTLFAEAKRKSNFNFSNNNNISISFKIHVPTNVASTVKTSGGNIHLASLTGAQTFTTSGGNIQFENLHGVINGQTSGGNIAFRNVDKDIKVSTSGGNISAEQANGVIQLNTSGGNISLNNVNGNLKAITSGGNINGSVLQGAFVVSTSGGNIALDKISGKLDGYTSGGQLAANFIKVTGEISLKNSGGNIQLNLPSNTPATLELNGEGMESMKNKLSNFNGSITKKSISGTINGGGVKISAATSGGSINFSQN